MEMTTTMDAELSVIWSWVEMSEGVGESVAGLDAGASHLVAAFAVSVAGLLAWILLSICTPVAWQVLGTARMCRVMCLLGLGLKTLETYLVTHLDAPTLRAAALIVPGLTYTSMAGLVLGQMGVLFLGQFVSAGGVMRVVVLLCVAVSAALDAVILSEIEVLLVCAEEGICGKRQYDVEAMRWRVVLFLCCFMVQVLVVNFCAYLVLLVGPCGVAHLLHSSELVSKVDLYIQDRNRRRERRLQRVHAAKTNGHLTVRTESPPAPGVLE